MPPGSTRVTVHLTTGTGIAKSFAIPPPDLRHVPHTLRFTRPHPSYRSAWSAARHGTHAGRHSDRHGHRRCPGRGLALHLDHARPTSPAIVTPHFVAKQRLHPLAIEHKGKPSRLSWPRAILQTAATWIHSSSPGRHPAILPATRRRLTIWNTACRARTARRTANLTERVLWRRRIHHRASPPVSRLATDLSFLQGSRKAAPPSRPRQTAPPPHLQAARSHPGDPVRPGPRHRPTKHRAGTCRRTRSPQPAPVRGRRPRRTRPSARRQASKQPLSLMPYRNRR